MSNWIAPFLIAATSLSVVSCTAAPTAKGKTPATNASYDATFYANAKKGFHAHAANYYADPALKLTVTDFDSNFHPPATAPLSTKDAADSGETDGDGQMTVTVGDKPPHPIQFLEQDFPPMSDNPNRLMLQDKLSKLPINFTADHEFVKCTATDGTSTLTIVRNPDGSFTINGQAAATPEAAANLILATDVCKNVTLQDLAGLYAAFMKREQQIATLAVSSFQAGAGDIPPDPAPLLRSLIMLREKTEL